MEIVGALLVLGLIGLALFGVLGSAGIAGLGKADKAKRDRDIESLDEVFDGSAHVVHEVGSFGLSVADTIRAGDERGYRVSSQSSEKYRTTLVFEKRSEA